MVLDQDLTHIADWIKQAPTRKVYILATYTATLDLRRVFGEQGWLEKSDAQ